VFTHQIEQLVQQIETMLTQLTDEEYSRPLAVFNDSSIGQHTRHVIEFFTELEQGYAQGFVDYDNRKRNKVLETNKAAAITSLKQIVSTGLKQDRMLQLAVRHGVAAQTEAVIATTYYRELAFAIEHTVHHMALIRIGAEQLNTVTLPAEFGVASSTQRYQSSCVQ
jgi:uncharacterized damage-inducible protein DinB